MNKIIVYKNKVLNNFDAIKQKTNYKICAVVKCNGYGLGAISIVKTLENKADFFAVANLEEALEIRKKFKNINILILGKITNYHKALKNNISITVENLEELSLIKKITQEKNITAKIHIKINTGMNRLGVDKILEFKRMLNLFDDKLMLEGVYTHFATTKTDLEFFNSQLENFDRFLYLIPKNLSPIIHIGGSGAIISCKKYDMIRVGIDLYTYPRLAFKLESRVINIRELNRGERVGYDNGFTSKKKTRVAIVNIGYGDGLDLSMKNSSVKIRNREYKIIGNLCMDMLFVHIDDKVKIGDKVNILFDINTLSKHNHLSLYKILTSLNGSRCKRCLRS